MGGQHLAFVGVEFEMRRGVAGQQEGQDKGDRSDQSIAPPAPIDDGRKEGGHANHRSKSEPPPASQQ